MPQKFMTNLSEDADIIAHRLNTLTYCNQLVVMTQGEIEAQGSHEELIEGDNSYKAMWFSMT